MQPTLSPQEFVHKWRGATLKERSAAQEHFIDLCHLVGHPTPAEYDPAGETFAFEAGTGKVAGGQGYADVWKKGYFAWEYKGKHADLAKAYEQLLQYRETLQNPPLLVVSDIDRIVIHTNFTNTVKQVVEIGLDDLLQPAHLAQLRAVFYDPQAFRAPETSEQVTQKAAADFARLAELLRLYGADAHQTAHFLIRLLFCLFAEDVDLLPRGLFAKLVERTRKTPGTFAAQVRNLFMAMAVGGWFGTEQILQFDGGLFDDDAVLDLDSESLDILMRVSRLDWSSIEPSIFGTLFERSLDPGKRAQLGAHYTSKDDILLIVEPVLMAPLRRRWEVVRARATELAERRDAARGAQRTKLHNELNALLAGFAGELAGVHVLDPACGSGNFLYVALRQLLDLWKEAAAFAGSVGLTPLSALEGCAPHPSQLRGIEINDYAHELAQATIWIGYIQWLHENGYGLPTEPVLKPVDTIKLMDAILAHDEQGRPVEPEWPTADVAIGNPPFLGGNRIRQELGDAYVDALFSLYEGRVPASADLVCYWFERARALVEAGNLRRAGLLATQAIRGGANRTVLQRIKATGDIFWAQSDREWVLDGAAVHVSMIGFDSGSEIVRELDGGVVPTINADLTAGADLSLARSLKENEGIFFRSDEKGGPFDIAGEIARPILRAPLNPNGRPNTDVVRPYFNARDITQRPAGKWIIDFGCDASSEEAALYELPFEYVSRVVRPMRAGVRNPREREYWWLHRRPAPDMRAAVAALSRYIATPRIAKHRLFVWLSGSTIPDSQLYVFARDDDYFLGVLHSRVHELWARAQGTQLREAESGFRYTPTSTFETFPFPWPPAKEPPDAPRVQAIAEAARTLVEERDRWLNPPGASEAELAQRTLTNLYNQRPTWLQLAHRRLDEAVLNAYGWPRDLGDEDILARLLALNQERAAPHKE